MKINLLLDNPGDIRSGYLNIDPFADGDSRVKGNVLDLDEFVDDGEATEIISHEVLDYVRSNEVDIVLQNWLKKLAHGGKITISTVDIREISRAVAAGRLNIDDTNELIHGKQDKAWQAKHSSFCLEQLSTVLSNRGYKILSARIQNYRCVVTAQRN